MKGIYEKVFKKELQDYIKELAEKHGITPLQALTRFDEAVSTGLDNKLKIMGVALYGDYGVNPVTAKEFYEQFKSEVFNSICPNWNSTIECDSFNTYINRRLVEEGYPTISSEMLEFLTEEIQEGLKPLKLSVEG